MKSLRNLCTAIASIVLSSCSASMPPSLASESRKVLLVVACPELTPLSDPSFGATTLKLMQVAGQYRECRAAALQAKEGGQ